MMCITCQQEIDMNKPIQVIYFFVPGMPFHNKILHNLSEIEESYKDISFLIVDCDDFPTQCIRFKITSAPTILVLKNGKEIKRLEGYVKKKDFTNAFADICVL